jgi:hypothetical protein
LRRENEDLREKEAVSTEKYNREKKEMFTM